MSIRRRGDAWQIRLYDGRVDGRDRYITRTVRGPRAAAERIEADLRAQLDAVKERRAGLGVETVAGFLPVWEDEALLELEPSTVRGYRRQIDRWIVPAFGGRRLDSIRAKDVHAVFTRQRAAGRQRSSRNTAIALRSLFAYAEQAGLVAVSPMRQVALPKRRKTPVVAPDADEIVRAIRAGDEYGDGMLGVFLRVSFAVAGRRGEVLALRWVDVDLDRARIHIRHSLDGETRGDVELKATKTGEEVTVGIDAGTVDALRRLKLRFAETCLSGGVRLAPTAYVFSQHPYGTTPPVPHWSTRAWQRARTRAGLEHVQTKGMRSGAATVALDAEVPLQVVSGMLRHADVKTTLTAYAGRTSAGLAKAQQALADVLADVAEQ